jgi:hypothetical protein
MLSLPTQCPLQCQAYGKCFHDLEWMVGRYMPLFLSSMMTPGIEPPDRAYDVPAQTVHPNCLCLNPRCATPSFCTLCNVLNCSMPQFLLL